MPFFTFWHVANVGSISVGPFHILTPHIKPIGTKPKDLPYANIVFRLHLDLMDIEDETENDIRILFCICCIL